MEILVEHPGFVYCIITTLQQQISLPKKWYLQELLLIDLHLKDFSVYGLESTQGIDVSEKVGVSCIPGLNLLTNLLPGNWQRTELSSGVLKKDVRFFIIYLNVHFTCN